jgi:hypothetical protein
MGWVWRAFKEPVEESRPAKRDPQYQPAPPGDGLWLGGPPKGTPEYKAWIRWMSS